MTDAVSTPDLPEFEEIERVAVELSTLAGKATAITVDDATMRTALP